MRTIPVLLQNDLDAAGTTFCYLLKIVAKNNLAFGVTSLDTPLTFDDGKGEIEYSANIGLNQSGVKSSAALDVDNSEAQMLYVEQSEFTESQVQAGQLDYARFFLYRVNWKKPENGFYIVASGTTGEVLNHENMAGIVELRGIPQQLKQTFVELYSITCRAPFGSILLEENKFPCRFDSETLWEDGVCQTVDPVEPDRVFTTNLPGATGPLGPLDYVPGVVQFIDGANAGAVVEIEDYQNGILSLRYAAPWPIEAGATFRARPDCAKRFKEDCIEKFDNHLNFRGEPLIPITGEGPTQTPGATYPGFGTGIVPGGTTIEP